MSQDQSGGREVVLVCGSGSGPWPTAQYTPQALLFKLILNLIKNKPEEAGVSSGPVTLKPEGNQEVTDILGVTEGSGESPPIIPLLL